MVALLATAVHVVVTEWVVLPMESWELPLDTVGFALATVQLLMTELIPL